MHFVSGQVKAVIVRRREDSEPEYQATLRCDRWEVVLPELVFEPDE
jgi:ATP-dependent DNA helicase RecQ